MDSGGGEEGFGGGHGEADDVGMAAGHAGDEGVLILDAISARLAAPFVGGDVIFNFPGGESSHSHRRHHPAFLGEIIGLMSDGDGSNDDVGCAGEEREHFEGVSDAVRFAEKLIAEGGDD